MNQTITEWQYKRNLLRGYRVGLESEPVDIPCPFCNHKPIRRRMSGGTGNPLDDGSWTHEHYYCGKCHEYICEECNPDKMIDSTGKPVFHQFSNCKNWVY